ncbi:penicillin-binding transpeptidase domain-containing protein [Hathewaya massiliensis]|uniref:penicillin-binding transpeptidase domain-containing protein n=1 Tax=Hathewaya massiliensis TaxID=1964382 RepID=UPI00163C8003|nr:penicillin-binding transpeptidase domain-containing protein [Hathewaya massiliensis]
MVFEGEQLKSKVNSQFFYTENMKDRNYKLIDKNGKEFIEYEKKYFAVIDTGFYLTYNKNKENDNIKKAKYILRDYKKEYNLPDEIEDRDFNKKIKYEINKETYDKLKEVSDIKGFYIYDYNQSKLEKNWNIVSIMDSANNLKDSSLKSKGTLEKTMLDIRKENEVDKILVQKELDTHGKKVILKNSNENLNFRLTLDKDIQSHLENIIRSENFKNYKDVGVILMESETGKILSMAQKDDNKPNINIGAASNNGYFPASIFKIVTATSAIDNNISHMDKIYKRNKDIKEYNNRENMSLKEGLIYSSNDIFYQVGEEVGFNNIYKYAKKFGLLDTVLGLQDEKNGKFEVDRENVSRDEVRHSAIGQKIRITPIEAINIPNVIINSGKFVRPYIIDAIVDENNKIIKNIDNNSEKVIKNSTAKIMENAMIDVVEDSEGTGHKAKVKGVRIGGKTGTSEYYEIKDGKRQKFSDGWFTGFFRINNKNYSMVVLVRDIDWVKRKDGGKEEDGGNTAAPIFKKIVENFNEKNLLN